MEEHRRRQKTFYILQIKITTKCKQTSGVAK